ncbi:MAG: threonine synthase, partial [Verrucomicrobiales bacterium]
VAVDDEEMIEAAKLIGRTQGIFAAPEGGASLVAFQKLRATNWIKDAESTVLFNTGSGHKYAHLFR